MYSSIFLTLHIFYRFVVCFFFLDFILKLMRVHLSSSEESLVGLWAGMVKDAYLNNCFEFSNSNVKAFHFFISPHLTPGLMAFKFTNMKRNWEMAEKTPGLNWEVVVSETVWDIECLCRIKRQQELIVCNKLVYRK